MTPFKRKYISVFLIALLSGCCLRAETKSELEDMQMTLLIKEKISDYIGDLESYGETVRKASPEACPELLKKFNDLSLRWNTYYGTYLGFIVDHDDLMESVSEYETLRELIQTALDELKAKMNAQDDFESAEAFIRSQGEQYPDLYRKATALSATSKLSGELEKLKGREQLIFAEIQEKFEAAGRAVEVLPSLSARMEDLNDSYVVLKCLSEKIQQSAYKPIIQRLKDYLLSIAAVALILMFVSMLRSKLKAARQMKENLKKTLEEYNKGKDDIPSI